MAAILYRINSQSRAIEDALMREGVAYKIVGSVRFYERKEIKDSLAYLKLIVNPFDDVSLRRVINVPARGIGRGVMDGLDAAGAAGRTAAAAGRRASSRSSRQTRSGCGCSARSARRSLAPTAPSSRWLSFATSSST